MDAATSVEVTPASETGRWRADTAARVGAPSPPELLACVADPVRWAVLPHLSASESCVCDIQTRVPVAANLLSYHLRVLREAGLILARKRGRWVDYRLAPDTNQRLTDALPVQDEVGRQLRVPAVAALSEPISEKVAR